MVAVYGSFEEGQAARPKAANFRKYAGALAGAWAVLFVAAVLIVGEQLSRRPHCYLSPSCLPCPARAGIPIVARRGDRGCVMCCEPLFLIVAVPSTCYGLLLGT